MASAGADKEILQEAERLDIKEKGPLILAELLLDENMIKQLVTYRLHFLRVSNNNRHCIIFERMESPPEWFVEVRNLFRLKMPTLQLGYVALCWRSPYFANIFVQECQLQAKQPLTAVYTTWEVGDHLNGSKFLFQISNKLSSTYQPKYGQLQSY